MGETYSIREIFTNPDHISKVLPDTWTVKYNMSFFHVFPNPNVYYPLMIAKDFTDYTAPSKKQLDIKFRKSNVSTDKKSLEQMYITYQNNTLKLGLTMFNDYFDILSYNASIIEGNYSDYLLSPMFIKFIQTYIDLFGKDNGVQLDTGVIYTVTPNALKDSFKEYFKYFEFPYPMYLLVHSLLSFPSFIFVHKELHPKEIDKPYYLLFSSTNLISYIKSEPESLLPIYQNSSSNIDFPYSLVLGSYSHSDMRNDITLYMEELIVKLNTLRSLLDRMPTSKSYNVHNALTEFFTDTKEGDKNVSIKE